jgi:acyl dehydratase
MIELRFDDVTSLQQRVGEPWSPFGSELLVSQPMIDQFAAVTGDHQWIHVDAERARRDSPLGVTIAHGFLLVSLLPSLRERRDLQIVGYGSILNYGADRLRFLSPVPAGSRIHARARIYSVEPKPKGTLIGSELELFLVGRETEKPALSYSMLLLYCG